MKFRWPAAWRRSLVCPFFLKFNVDPSYSPVKDKVFVKNQVGDASYLFHCHQLWMAPQIDPEGNLLGCCYNNGEKTYGNVFKYLD